MVKYPYWQHLRAPLSLSALYQLPLGLPPPCPRAQESHLSPAQPRSLVSLWRLLLTWAAPTCPAPSKTRAQTVIFERCVEIHQFYKERSCVLNVLLSVSFSNAHPFQNLGMCFHVFSGMTYPWPFHCEVRWLQLGVDCTRQYLTCNPESDCSRIYLLYIYYQSLHREIRCWEANKIYSPQACNYLLEGKVWPTYMKEPHISSNLCCSLLCVQYIFFPLAYNICS